MARTANQWTLLRRKDRKDEGRTLDSLQKQFCTCPNCGTSIVRRKHRMRRGSASLCRAFNLAWLLPMHLLMAALAFGTSFVFAVVTETNAREVGLSPIAYLAPSFARKDLHILLSNATLLMMVMTIPFLGGVWFGHHLTHWKKPGFFSALVVISIVLAGLPMIGALWTLQPIVEFEKLLRSWPLRLEMTGLCSAMTMLGFVLAHPSAKLKKDHQNERFRKKLSRARRRLTKRRTPS